MIEAYKGFDKCAHGIECRGYIFEEGKTYTLDKPPILCQSGFHACLDPLNVLDYYTPIRTYTRDRFGHEWTVHLYPSTRIGPWYTITYPYGTLHNGIEYHKVYIEGDVDINRSIFFEYADDTKICTNKIRIGEKINLDDIMQIHLKLLDEFQKECAPQLNGTNYIGLELTNKYKIVEYCSWLTRKMVLPHITQINNKYYDDNKSNNKTGDEKDV